MAIAIMRMFPGYTLHDIMEMPYCHFVYLFSMAEKASDLLAYTILQGSAAINDKNMIDDLSNVAKSKYVQPKIVFPKQEKDKLHGSI